MGSHVTLRHPEQPGKKVVVPVHPGRPLKPKVLQRILKEAELTVDQLRELL
ncbi:MAG: type II toxin-antitoxin system HicA family toxin [Candidatus Rokubacteria bacterium]|nr:type II toxin-antitoxin system HicA family toxin [Candidatus Rokubacteria bacterium]